MHGPPVEASTTRQHQGAQGGAASRPATPSSVWLDLQLPWGSPRPAIRWPEVRAAAAQVTAATGAPQWRESRAP